MACTLIIPFHNEGNRILTVLDEVQKMKSVAKVICIDDGSTDNATTTIKKNYPNVKVVSIPTNVGKTEAVRHGVELAKTEYVVLLDADLRNLKHREIDAAIQAMQNDSGKDMVVLRRINAPWNIKLFRGDVLIPGERVMKTEELREAIAIQKPTRYQLEFAINKYMLDNHKAVYWAPSSALNTWPTSKLGFAQGMRKIVAMQANILRYIGPLGYVKQLLFFCRKKLV